MSQLEDLLRQCTVKLTVPGQMGWGTGFFVAPGLILTCAHVVQGANGKPIQIFWQNQENWTQAVVERSLPKPYDLALLRITVSTSIMPPCVYLDEIIESRDPLYLFGYPDRDFPNGCPVTPNCEGLTGDESPLVKFALGQVRPGMSGSPILNQRTRKVCGIVKFTRDRSSDLGGGGIPTRVILEHFPELCAHQEEFHQQDNRWTILIETNGKTEKYLNYLNQIIEEPLDEKTLSGTNNQKISLRQLYVQLKIQEIHQENSSNNEPIDSHSWVKNLLRSNNRKQIIFIQGDSGQGKTALCRMVASEIYREKSFDFIPIFIQFQDLSRISNKLVETLETCLQAYPFFYSKEDWFTDSKQKFLVMLDGFDEITLPPEDVEVLIKRIIEFQRSTQNQFLITSRSLASQEAEEIFGGYDCLISGQLQLMNSELQSQWIDNWSRAISDQDAGEEFRVFLEGDPTRSGCPNDIKSELAGEPLSLYLLASLFHSGDVSHRDFVGSDEAEGRVKIYQKALDKALQRVAVSKIYKQLSKKRKYFRIADLEYLLMETALCIVYSNSESVSTSAIKQRFEDSSSPLKKWIDESFQDKNKDSDVSKLINSLLTSFYICLERQGNDTSLRFVHKSFGEFLFAEKLKQTALENFYLKKYSKEVIYKSIYELIGHGELTKEIVKYFTILIFQEDGCISGFGKFKKFFSQLYEFYWDWSEDNRLFESNTLEHISKSECGFRHRDIYVGINIIILLLELCRYARLKKYPMDLLPFHLCHKGGDSLSVDTGKLLRLIGYSYFLNKQSQEYNSDENFTRVVGGYLEKIDLSNAKLTGVNLSNADLRGAILSKADLRRSVLFGADLRGADFRGADLSGCDLREAKLDKVNLNDAVLVGASWSLDLGNTDFNSADLSHSSFRNANLENATLQNTNLQNTSFRNANLKNAIFSSGEDLSIIENKPVENQENDEAEEIDSLEDKEYFVNTDFSKANLQRAGFEGLDLTSVDFECANLKDVNLKDAILDEANFFGADLTNANLEGAYLGGADLRNANLQNANLEGAYLGGADLRNANLSGSSLKNIKYNRLTVWETALGIKNAQDVPSDWLKQLAKMKP